jgi:triacylglycerol lipase
MFANHIVSTGMHRREILGAGRSSMNIVLVHGILGFRKRFGVEYFRGVAEHFQEKGLKVLVPELDPTQGVEFRGNQLCDQINAGFANGSLLAQEKTHIIAHSMGGLDSRYVLSPVSGKQLDSPVHSLTTISTPHRGSPIADLVDKPADFSPFSHLPFNPFGNPLEAGLAAAGISLDGLRDLKTATCQAFSAKYTDNPHVAYFSVSGSGRAGVPATASFFLLFHAYISAHSGQENDGMVAVPSGMWGKFDANTWPGDHAEMVGYNLDNLLLPPAFQYLAKFDRIVDAVSAI